MTQNLTSKVDEDQYKVDLVIADRFDGLATELFRLALISIAAYGFLFSEIVFSTNAPMLGPIKWPLGTGVLVLAISAAFALAHRYFSTLCIYHHVRMIRATHSETITEAKSKFEKHRKVCGICMLGSVFCLAIGAIAVAGTFAIQIFRAT